MGQVVVTCVRDRFTHTCVSHLDSAQVAVDEPSVRESALVDQMGQLRTELDFYRERAISLDNQVFQMRTLLQSGKGFSELLSVSALLAAIIAVCRERYDIDSACILLRDDLAPGEIRYRVRASHGLSDTYIDPVSLVDEELLLFKFPRDQGLLWQVIQQGDVFSVRDMAGKPRFRTAFSRWNLSVLRSETWVPLICGGDVLGLIALGLTTEGTPILESEYGFLQEISSVAATNIDSCVKYEKNERILKNLRTLYDVNQQLTNVHDFQQLTIECLSTAVDALNAQKANLMLFNPETQRLEIKVVWGNIPPSTRDAINEGRLETRTFAVGEGVSGEAARTRQPVRINERGAIEQVGRNPVFCILAMPLIYGSDVVGVITLTNKVKQEDGHSVLDPLGRFGEEDEQLLLGLADQASVNLHKAKLYSASITDRLTGMFNARQFEIELTRCIDEARGANIALCLTVFDIDHFKVFNDSYGHRAGDFVLSEVARMTRERIASDGPEMCFRYGGEEFCIVSPGATEADAWAAVEALRRDVESASLVFEGQSLSVTFSAGIASFPEHGSNRGALFESADAAMYRAKQTGRNRTLLASDVIAEAGADES